MHLIQHMKQWLCGLLSATVLLGLAGCNGTVPNSSEASQAISDTTQTTTTTETSFVETTTYYETTASTDTTYISIATTTLAEAVLDRNGSYTTKEDVSLYLYTYGELPSNFITKKEAQALGWTGGSLEPYAPGKCIGGSYFGNYEQILPTADGRSYMECDIDTLGRSSRGAKRIVFSNDGLIYYTEDHYETFTLLYGEESP